MLIETCKRMTSEFRFNSRVLKKLEANGQWTEQICAVFFKLEATPFRARSICRARNDEENGVKNTRQPEGTSEAASVIYDPYDTRLQFSAAESREREIIAKSPLTRSLLRTWSRLGQILCKSLPEFNVKLNRSRDPTVQRKISFEGK